MLIEKIFANYDKLIMGLPPVYSGIMSLAILVFLAWIIWKFIKGNFAWIGLLIILIPATWPSLKSLLRFLILVGQFLITRIKL